MPASSFTRTSRSIGSIGSSGSRIGSSGLHRANSIGCGCCCGGIQCVGVGATCGVVGCGVVGVGGRPRNPGNSFELSRQAQTPQGTQSMTTNTDFEPSLPTLRSACAKTTPTRQSPTPNSSEKRSPKSVTTRSDGGSNFRSSKTTTGPLRLEDDSDPIAHQDELVTVVPYYHTGPLDQVVVPVVLPDGPCAGTSPLLFPSQVSVVGKPIGESAPAFTQDLPLSSRSSSFSHGLASVLVKGDPLTRVGSSDREVCDHGISMTSVAKGHCFDCKHGRDYRDVKNLDFRLYVDRVAAMPGSGQRGPLAYGLSLREVVVP